jgi:hypothetical protein
MYAVNRDRLLSTDAWGREKTYQDYSIVSGLFTSGISDQRWKASTDGVFSIKVGDTTEVASVDGYLSISPSTLNQSKGLQSKRHPIYQPNRGHLYSASMIIKDHTYGICDYGIFTVDNGVFFRVKEDGTLWAVRRTLGAEVAEEQISLDTGFDITKGHLYDIQFQWRGVGNYMFYVDNKLVHKMALLGTLDALSIANPALPVGFLVTKTVNGGNPELRCG